jgi:hypothetical protein
MRSERHLPRQNCPKIRSRTSSGDPCAPERIDSERRKTVRRSLHRRRDEARRAVHEVDVGPHDAHGFQAVERGQRGVGAGGVQHHDATRRGSHEAGSQVQGRRVDVRHARAEVARGIEQAHAVRQLHLEDIARRPRDVRHQELAAAEQRVAEARLAGVGRPEENEIRRPCPDGLLPDELLEPTHRRADRTLPDLRRHLAGLPLLEVETRLQERAGVQDAAADRR